MDATIQDYIDAFGLRKKGNEWVGPCPSAACNGAGDDRFHVKEDNGHPVFGCRRCLDDDQDPTGENARSVLAQVRLTSTPNPNGRQPPPPRSAGKSKFKPKAPPKPRPLPTGPNYTPYRYDNEDGELAFYHMRHDRGPKDKSFAPYYPADNGLYISEWRDNRPLYRLPQLMATPGVVYLAEGEKCVDSFARAFPGVPVTTWSGGTPAWDRTDYFPLSLREVVLLADADDRSRKAMRGIAKELEAMACTVHFAFPPGETGEDVADWLDQDPPEKVWAYIERLRQLGQLGAISQHIVALTDHGETPKAPALLVRQDGETLLYSQRLNTVYGIPGVGKSWLALMASKAAVRNGGRVLWWDFEDNAGLLADRAKVLRFKDALDQAKFVYAKPSLYEEDQTGPGNIAAAIAYLLGARDSRYSLLVLDSAESAGCPSDGSEIVSWFRTYMNPFQTAGVGVVLLDHVPKRSDGRPRGGIGAQGKLRAVTGAALMVEGIPWTKQSDGRLTLKVHKDRVGDLPAPAGRAVADLLGAYSLEGTQRPFSYQFAKPAREDGEVDLKVARMLLEALGKHPDGVRTQRGYRELLSGRESKKDNAMRWLVGAGLVTKCREGNGDTYSVTNKGRESLFSGAIEDLDDDDVDSEE